MKFSLLNIFKKSIRKIKIAKSIEKKGFVILQIDGLSYVALKKALSLNLMPKLKKMINSGDYLLDDYFTGVPSDTPFFQAGLLYGNNDDIPGFRWIERETGEEIIFKKPESAGHIEERLAKKNLGLLKGGSSYVNLFSGGASRSTFTLSTFSIRYLFKKKVRNFDIFIVFVFHIFTFLKTFFYVFFEALLEIQEKIQDIAKKREVRPEGFFPFARAMTNVIFKEIETFGAIMDISRGVPSIYSDYIGYDELSHHRGPYSYSALRTLKAIDRKIHDINKAILKSERKYDFFIISDHGHTPSIPFQKANGGKMLKDAIYEHFTDHELKVYEFDTGYNAVFKRLFLYMGDFFKKGTCKKIYNSFIGEMKSVKEPESMLAFQWQNEKTIYIMDSGPMANIYFSGKHERMATEEIENKYDKLINMLANLKGIGFIAGINERGEASIYDKEYRKFCILKNFVNNSADKNFTIGKIIGACKTKSEAESTFSSLERFTRFKNSGDLILFGEYDGKNIINFENQMGAHGGIGGEQNKPFAVRNSSVRFDFTEVNNSCKIYDFLYNEYINR